MTVWDFNTKWGNYLLQGYYGLDINHIKVIEYLDSEFTKELEVNPDFYYMQIKIKFGHSRVYTNSEKDFEWEKEIDKLFKLS